MKSKAIEQLVNDILALPPVAGMPWERADNLRAQLRNLLYDRNVRCDLIQHWGDEEIRQAAPTGYPAQPTGSTPADVLLDSIPDLEDPQSEIFHLRQRLEALQERVNKAPQVRQAIPVRKARKQDTREALRRMGYDPDDYSPY